jgi:hypothetical protein
MNLRKSNEIDLPRLAPVLPAGCLPTRPVDVLQDVDLLSVHFFSTGKVSYYFYCKTPYKKVRRELRCFTSLASHLVYPSLRSGFSSFQ